MSKTLPVAGGDKILAPIAHCSVPLLGFDDVRRSLSVAATKELTGGTYQHLPRMGLVSISFY